MDTTVKRIGMRAWALLILLVVNASVCRGVTQFGDAWEWPLAPRRFGALSQQERIQYSRGEDLIRQRNYDAAAVEFEKFMAQYPRSDVRSHALLLRAYSLHLARQRNQAISLYTEVLDFYRQITDDAAPAAFLKGNAQIQNGNVETGMRTLRELVEDAELVRHPIADLALNQLAEYALKQDEPKQAERYWLQVLDLFQDAFFRPEGAVKTAREKLMDLFIMQARPDALESLLERQVPGHGSPLENVNAAYARAYAVFGRMDEDARRSFFRWFRRQVPVYDATGDESLYLEKAIAFAKRLDAKSEWNELCGQALVLAGTSDNETRVKVLSWLAASLADVSRAGWRVDNRWGDLSEAVIATADTLDPDGRQRLYDNVIRGMTYDHQPNSAAQKLWDVVIARAAELYAALMNPDRDKGLAGLVDKLVKVGEYSRAFDMAGRIESAGLAQWKRIEILGSQEKYEEMAEACRELEEMDSGSYGERAMQTRADLYKNNLARYEDAIKLYNMINNPPRSIWSIVACYEKLKEPASAVQALSELESFFEADAPRAAFHKALVWERAGNEDRAIAACRSVLKKYPKHQVSSQAHQMLERYGIKTGGGVMELD